MFDLNCQILKFHAQTQEMKQSFAQDNKQYQMKVLHAQYLSWKWSHFRISSSTDDSIVRSTFSRMNMSTTAKLCRNSFHLNSYILVFHSRTHTIICYTVIKIWNEDVLTKIKTCLPRKISLCKSRFIVFDISNLLIFKYSIYSLEAHKFISNSSYCHV